MSKLLTLPGLVLLSLAVLGASCGEFPPPGCDPTDPSTCIPDLPDPAPSEPYDCTAALAAFDGGAARSLTARPAEPPRVRTVAEATPGR